MMETGPNLTTEQTNQEQAECSFVWDEQSQLYFHARSGFYHDPNAGWYYSTSDGLYYKFEDGNYVLLEGYVADDQMSEQPSLSAESCIGGDMECSINDESGAVRPTSEWLEDTLINMYLAGYSNQEKLTGECTTTTKTGAGDDGNGEDYELEEGEWIPEHNDADPSKDEPATGMSLDEENWLAQYGQVSQPKDEGITSISAVNLWDWEIVLSTRKDGKSLACRLIGRLVRQNTKLHPSMPAGGRLLKTAPISEARLDLVRVTTGQIYKLRNPSKKYLASLTVYDSSNPTKDWSVPILSMDEPVLHSGKITGNLESDTTHMKEKSMQANKIVCASEKRACGYRDRAAERRNLHGGFGVGPGQKKTTDDDDTLSSPVSVPSEIAAAEALNISFGEGSFSRKLLEKMGWKEGEALGRTNNGLKEPIQAVQNKGNAGLGWSR